MLQRVIKKVVEAVIVKEKWSRIVRPKGEGFYYQCEGEVKNIGLSRIRNLLVIGALYKRGGRRVLKFVDKKLQYSKAGGYFSIDKLEPGELATFVLTVSFPKPGDLIWGKKLVRNLDEMIKKGAIRRKAFLVFDSKSMDEKAQQWFQSELIDRLTFLEKNWEFIKDTENDILKCRSWGVIKNAGDREIDNLLVVSAILDYRTREPIWWPDPREETGIETETTGMRRKFKRYEARASFPIENFKAGAEKSFDFVYEFPHEGILSGGKWNLKDIHEGMKNELLEHSMFVELVESDSDQDIYRDTLSNPALIQDAEGELKAEVISPTWTFEESSGGPRYICSGTVENTGTMGIENLYIIASIIDKDNEKPIIWDIGTAVKKTMQIERIPYLDVRKAHLFSMTVQLQEGKSTSEKFKNQEDIIKGIREGTLLQHTDLYFKKSDVREEALKRLNLGNAYFRLGNVKVSANEFKEAIHLQPDEYRGYMNLALIYYKSSKYADALKIIRKLLDLKPNYSKAYYLAGLIYYKLENWEEAEANLKQSLKIEKTNPKILYNIACIYFGQGNVNTGLEWLKKAIEIDRNSIIAQIMKDSELNEVRRDPNFIELLQS